MMLYTLTNSIVLGFFSVSHIGDAMCTSTLPRKIFQHYHKTVYVVHHPSTVAVFANNPYVAGFENEDRVKLTTKLIGYGHIIQKLERAFGLPMDFVPKPELYFSDEELRWALQERGRWPQDKPICILNTGCVTDEEFESYSSLDWQQIADILSNYFTIIHPVIDSIEHYKKQCFLEEKHRRIWKKDKLVSGVIPYTNLPVRRYMSLFTVADYYCGPTGGGPQVAAALEVPSLVILNNIAKPENVKFPNRNFGLVMESFIYPQHTFIRTENLYPETFDCVQFSESVESMISSCSVQGQSLAAWQVL